MKHLVGWIILAVVVFILLLILFTPFGVAVDYASGQLTVAAKVMGAGVTVYPPPKKKKAKPKRDKKPKAEKPAKERKPKKEKPPLITKDMIPELLRLLGRTLTRFRRKLTVNRFVLHITFGGADPCSSALSYGAANAAFATVGRRIGGAFDVKRSDVRTALDFSAEKTTFDAGLTVTISLARILAVAASAGAGFIKIKRRADKAKKAAARERKETDERDADPNGGIPQDKPGQN